MGHSFSQPDHPVPASDHAHQTTSTSPAVAGSAPIESHPLTQSPPSSSLHPVSQPSHPLPHSTPTLSPAQPSRTPQPAVFYVPRNSRQIVLDFSDDSLTPESKAKHALLSDDPNNNAIALVGMGGAGKTTILRALGRHADVWQRFPDGVWFIELGHDAKVQRLFDQLEQIVTDAFPDFLPKFAELTAKDNTHVNMMEKLVDLLGSKRFLLIFDDMWDLDSIVYKLVDITCKGVQEMDGGSCTVLMSTRNEAIGRVPTHDVSIAVSPGDVRRETCIEILCGYSGIDCTRLSSWSSPNRGALDKIVDLCAGLPLALSVAGSGMQEVIGRCGDVSGPNGIVQYWESVKRSNAELRDPESGSRHVGVGAAIQTSLESLERGWKGKSMTMGEMFRSFCVVEKRTCIPLCVIEKIWGVEDALARVRMFWRHSLVSLDEDEGGLVRGIRLHDLVHDVCVEMAGGKEGVRGWHCRLVDGYRGSLRTSQGAAGDCAKNEGESTESEDEWWKLKETEKYMSDNVVRHLLGAGRVSATLKLLTDYRWTEKMNKDKERAPFQKVIGELELVRRYLEEDKTEIGRRIARDLYIVTRVMELCMIPYCMKNREECTFQLFGRLRDVVSESGVVERIVCSIERYAERPWARCGPGVLTSGKSLLRRVLEVEGYGECMCVSGGGEEVIVGGRRGEVWVLDGRDGRVKRTLTGDEDSAIVGVFFDRISGLMYSCNRRGQVTIWKEEHKLRSMHAEVEDEEEKIWCMQVLPSSKKVVLGTSKGRLLVMDATSGRIVRTVATDSDGVTSLAIGGSETMMVSASLSWYNTIRAWDTKSFYDSGTVLKGDLEWGPSVALSADGRLLASASENEGVRFWDMQSGEELRTSPPNYFEEEENVLFSADGRLLYAVGTYETSVWRVMNGGRDVSLAHTLPIPTFDVKSIGLGDGPELFLLSGGRVQVWDARPSGSSDNPDDTFLPHGLRFRVSENGTTMLTWNHQPRQMEIRNVCDVSERIDRVISSFKFHRRNHAEVGFPYSLAVSNNQKFVAYSFVRSCVVYIADALNGNVLHSLSHLEQWACSLTPDEQDDASNSSSSTAGVNPYRDVGILSFSSGGNVISAFAAANRNQNWNRYDGNPPIVETKSVSWNVSSGELMDQTHLDADGTATSSTATPRLVCNAQFDGDLFRFPRNVTYEHGRTSFTIATVEDHVYGAHYVADTFRLIFSSVYRGMCYVDLITNNTHLPPRNAPPLPLLKPHSLPPPPQHTITDSEPDQVYDVFISHAGTDKFTIALPLYNLLVALGFKVFLDRAELRPGENAPEKMIKAMRTAKIAVVILSPEYAARKWTLKELMCFLERFRAGGEREIIIIPVFYRLTLDDCRNENSLFGAVNDKGENVFVVEGFLKWMSKQEELTNKKVLKGLQSLRGVTGIENEAKVTNGKSEEEKAGQMQFAEKIRDAVVEAKDRQNSGRAAGPSSAR